VLIKVATRGSKLSLIQTKLVIDMIRRVEPNAKFELVIVRTTGDVVQDKPFYSIGVKGIFEREVNSAILKGEADIAVHSMKDLPSELNPELIIAGYPPRDPPHDVVVTSKDALGIHDLPKGAKVGTSSMRRRAFLMSIRADLDVEVIRGNVDTRLRKLLSGNYDALILAEAGLVRLMRDDAGISVQYSRIPLEVMPPAPGQGIIAAVARRNSDVAKLLESASDPLTRAQALAERAFLASIGGGCHVPLGGVAVPSNGELEFIAGLASLDGDRVIVRLKGSLNSPEELGRKAAEVLRERGDHILRRLRGNP